MRTLRQKLIVSFTLLAAALIVIASTVNYATYMKGLRRNMGTTMTETSRQLAVNLNQFLQSVADNTTQPLKDQKIQSLVENEDGLERWQQLQQAENYLLESILLLNPKIAAAYLQIEGWPTISRFNRVTESYEHRIFDSPDYNRVLALKGSPLLTDTSFYESKQAGTRFPTFTVYRLLNHTYTGKPYAVLAVDINANELDAIFGRFSDLPGAEALVYSASGQVVYSSDKSLIGQPLPREDDASLIRSEPASALLGWQVMTQVPVATVSNQAIWIRNSAILISLSSIAIALLVSAWFSNKITRPLLQLQRLMKRAENGQFHLKFEAKTKDEIAQLGYSYNRMTSEIEALIGKVYLAQIRHKEAELAALQHQIHPHFLFNSLESIRMMAEINEDYETTRMISSLGQILQETIRPRKTTRLGMEMKFVRNYVYLQSFRLPHPLCAELVCDERLLETELPPLLLQPLAENAIQHGLKPKQAEGTLTIEAEELPDGRLRVAVRDDGVGMSPDVLARVTDSFRSDSPPSAHGIGVWNVYQRVLRLYGDEGSFELVSVPGQGTCVTLVFPPIRPNGGSPHELPQAAPHR